MLNTIATHIKIKVSIPVTTINFNLNEVSLITGVLAKAINKGMSGLTICISRVAYRSTVLLIFINYLDSTSISNASRKRNLLSTGSVCNMRCILGRSLFILSSCAINSDKYIKKFRTGSTNSSFSSNYFSSVVLKRNNLSLSELNLTRYRVRTSLERKQRARNITRRARAFNSLILLDSEQYSIILTSYISTCLLYTSDAADD